MKLAVKNGRYAMKNTLTIKTLFIIITSQFLLFSYSFSASWPLFRGNDERKGALIEEARPILTPRWNFQIQGDIVSSPVVYKGIVYFGGRDNSIWAFDAYTGEVIWQYSTSGWIDATPCVSSDTVFVPSRDKNVYAFDRLTGELKWQTYTGSSDISSPVFNDGKIYFLSGNPEKKIYCIDALNGQIIVSYPVSQFGFSSPAFKDKKLFFGTNDGVFHCLDLDTGLETWSKETKGGLYYSSLAAGDNALYAVSDGDESKLFCLNPATKEVIWYSVNLDTRTTTASSVALGENKVFVISTLATETETKLRIFAFPLDKTSPVSPDWSVILGNAHPTGIISSPAVANDTLYIGTGDGMLYCLDVSSGEFIAPATGGLSPTATGYYLSNAQSHSVGIVASPTVSNGWIYVGSFDGNFWALQAGNVSAIAFPDNNDIVSNTTEILGTVTDPAQPEYIVEYGAGIDPDSSSWLLISSGTAQVEANEPGEIGYWNTANLNDGTYSIRLTVNNDASRKAINRVQLDNSPQPPTVLKAEDTPFDDGGSINLSWTKSSDDGAGDIDVTGYRIYKSTFQGSYVYIGQTANGITAYTDTNAPAQTTFYYVLTSIDQLNESEYSNTAGSYSEVDGVEILPETGGTVQLNHNGLITEIYVEPGSVASRVTMGIGIPGSYPETGIPKSAVKTGIVREFGVVPSDTKFLKYVTIKIPYSTLDAMNMKRENLRIYWWDETKELWRIVNTSDPDTEDGRVWARIPHFSKYRIMEYAPGKEELLTKDNVYTYPNPAKGDKVSFKYYLGDKADVTLDVYNVAGEIVAHYEKNDNPAGIVSEFDWNISNTASGVYVYRIVAKSASKTKEIKKKMAIIH